MNTYFNTAKFIAESITKQCIEKALIELKSEYKFGGNTENLDFVFEYLVKRNQKTDFFILQWFYILEWAYDLA